ncbi:hypothetical protein FALCPG4_015286 [Fusarium falciforme]
MSESDEVKSLKKELAETRAALLVHKKTTFDEYLRYCHEHLFKSLKVRAPPAATSSQSTTTVNGKYYPLKLRPWEDFITSQRTHYNIMRDVLSNSHLLPSLSEVESVTEDALMAGPVTCEADLKEFEYRALENPVGKIFRVFGPLCQSHRATKGLKCDKVVFRNRVDALTETDPVEHSRVSAQPIQKRRGQSGPQKKVIREQDKPRIGVPDRWCTRDETMIAFPVEYKAAHKITVEDFVQALRKEDLFSSVLRRVSSHKLSAGDDRVDERAEERVAKALAQTFHYMVCCRTSFGYLTAGNSLIFLHVGEDARVLYYHMVHPDTSAEGETLDPFFTAVAQLSAFCLQSFLDPGKTEQWLESEQADLQVWPNMYADMREPTAELPSSSPPAATTASYDPSSSFERDTTRSPQTRRTRSSCKDTHLPEGRSGPDDTDSDASYHSEDDGDVSEALPSLTVALEGSNKRKKGSSDSSHSASTNGSSFNLADRQYCTQACLLGLKRKGLLDENCPNVALHRAPGGGACHRIGASEFIQIVDRQMNQPYDRYRYCKPVEGKYGAIGQLFKLSLRPYGYTFVGKGTFAAAVLSIEHEKKVYSQLEPLQGHIIPVSLGSIDLQTPYPLMMSFIVHMLLLSWGGDQMADEAYVKEQQKPLQRLLRTHGVFHNDLRHQNLLWNNERGSVMLIDFNLATIEPPLKHKQISRLSGKRKRRDTGDSGRRAIPFVRS